MPFQVQCESCGAKFHAPDRLAGKQVPCPKCHAPLRLEGATANKVGTQPNAVLQPKQEAPVATPFSAKEPAVWWVQGAEGELYGPVTKSALDHWVSEGRLDHNCQVLKEGWDQWKWAGEVYPQLAKPKAPAVRPVVIIDVATPLRRDLERLEKQRRWDPIFPFVFGVPALLVYMLLIYVRLSDRDPESHPLILLYLLHAVLMGAALACSARYKGRSRAWGLFGLFSCLGLLIAVPIIMTLTDLKGPEIATIKRRLRAMGEPF